MSKIKNMLIIMMLLISTIAFTGCSSLEGKWYDVSSNSESNIYNLEFKSGETVSQGGIEGTYEEDGDEITVNFAGMEFDLTHEEIAGCDVLHWESGGRYFVKSLDDVEKVRKEINE